MCYILYAFAILPFNQSYTVNDDEYNDSVKYVTVFAVVELTWLCVLVLFSCYFIFAERKQLAAQGCKDYFSSGWNYADFVPPLGIIAIFYLNIMDHSGHRSEMATGFRYSLQGVVCFGMFIKIFYFLRVFRNTGFFVNMLIKIIFEIRVFGLLYSLVILSFAFTYYIQAPPGYSPTYFLN